MIMDAEGKNRFKLRSKIVSGIRRFFEDKGFLEVETPMMHPIPGGANAKPFTTHHNALDVDRYLTYCSRALPQTSHCWWYGCRF